jgi:enoyl-CoA hydratase/carnithine racemase
VSAVVEPEEVMATALEWAERVAVAPRANLVRTKSKALARGGVVAGTGTLDL